MTPVARIAMAVAAGFSAPIVAAQDAERTRVDQVAARLVKGATAIQQIDRASPGTDTASSQGNRATDAVTQLTRPDDRITSAAASGSVRADGRPTAVTAIGGADRCDPATPNGDAAPICANPIERRADQFRGPRPPKLSPEQRLAIARQTGDVATIKREADRLAGVPDGKPLSMTEQGIATLVLKEPPTPPVETEKGIDPAQVEALIQSIGTLTPER